MDEVPVSLEKTEGLNPIDHAPATPGRQHPRLIGPVVLIAIGLMFLIGQFVPHWGIGKTWPALLIVIGIVKLFDANRPPRPPQGPRV
jgi:LiaI-LiaF-like transmembrane region